MTQAEKVKRIHNELKLIHGWFGWTQWDTADHYGVSVHAVRQWFKKEGKSKHQPHPLRHAQIDSDHKELFG